ncbi:MAG: metal-dependent hydrolase [Candidatus Aenigmarchaeota archaeon]|nr:metal-dependent hydrolase [Candidatus Aenigmarchaeota archaeon]
MDIIAHFIAGLYLSIKFENYWALFFGCIMDIDHVIGYLYDKRKKVKIEIPSLLHLAYRPRSWFHSLSGLLIVSIPFLFFLSPELIFIPLFIHLFLDLLDKNGIYILPPFIKRRIKGSLPVGYLIEDPTYLKTHKRSHIPSLLVSVIFLIFIILKV